MLEIAYLGEYGREVAEQSALNLLLLIGADGARDLSIYGESDELFHAKNGSDSFPTALAAQLAPGQLELDARLERLRSAADGRVLLTFRRDASSFEVLADRVVLALPFSILRELDVQLPFDAQKKKAIAETGYGTNAKLQTGFSTRFWRDPLHNTGATFADLAYQSSWDTSRLQPGTTGILTNFVGGQRGLDIGSGSPESQRDAFLDDIDRVLPGAKAASTGAVARFHWPTNEFVKASYGCWTVGQYTTIAGSEILAQGNVHFCGEHTSVDAQGFMEGGALTGELAAREVAAALGVSVGAQALTARARATRRRALRARRARSTRSSIDA